MLYIISTAVLAETYNVRLILVRERRAIFELKVTRDASQIFGDKLQLRIMTSDN